MRKKARAFVDVDTKKIETNKVYDNRELDAILPIVHFSALKEDHPLQNEATPLEDTTVVRGVTYDTSFARANLTKLPVVVCVSLGSTKTGGSLRGNVYSVGRVEGETLYFFT